VEIEEENSMQEKSARRKDDLDKKSYVDFFFQ